MNFASDNVVGVSAGVIEALARANEGSEVSYGADRWTAEAETRLRELFERDIAVFLVATGTAANALSLAAITPAYGAVLCHEDSHINVDECGAPELFTGGAKLLATRGRGALGKLDAAAIDAAIDRLGRPPHSVKPAAISITQATEWGTVYRMDELREIGEVARRRDLKVHMDGARFANALVELQVSPAEMTWQVGVDVLSFGFTKNGALGVEAVVFFNLNDAAEFHYLRKRAGHLWSKGRFLGAQLVAMLEDDLWLRNASHANRMARRLRHGLRTSPGIRFPVEPDANALFPILPTDLDARLRAAGARYHEWPPNGLDEQLRPRQDEVMVRMLTSFATREDEIDALVELAHRG